MRKNIRYMFFALFLPVLTLSVHHVAMAAAKCTANGKEVDCTELNGVFGVGIAFLIFILILSLATTVFWIIMLIHAASKPIENKALWILIIVFAGLLGSIIYYFVVKRNFDKELISSPMQPTPPAQ